MLILFDIDGTMLRSESIGVRAMETAGRDLYGDDFSLEGIEIAGRMDCLIWRDAAARNNITNVDGEHIRFRKTYTDTLKRHLDERNTVNLLPGINDLVNALSANDDVTIGLLTGNYPETGRMKVEAGGIDSNVFRINAFGDSGRSRRDLPARAMNVYQDELGSTIDPSHVIIMGDTPHDVDCAQHHGCRSLAVTTGRFDRQSLENAGADVTFDDLGDTAAVLDWMLRP